MTASTALSVNVNLVAQVRNRRNLGYPSVTRAAEICLQAGAAGITVHPRPDQRHIRTDRPVEHAFIERENAVVTVQGHMGSTACDRLFHPKMAVM